MSLYLGPDGTQRLGDILREDLAKSWTRARFAAAYLKMSGLDHLHDLLESFASADDRVVRGTIGIDQHGTSYEALAGLLDILDSNGQELFIFHNPRSKGSVASPTFHPKIWLFDEGETAKLFVGSGNLTRGGLYTNYEVGTVQVLDLRSPRDRGVFDQAVSTLDRWADPTRGDVKRLDTELLDELYNTNAVFSEDEIRRVSRNSARTRVLAGKNRDAASVGGAIFEGEDFQTPPAPPAGRRATRRPPSAAATPATTTPVLPQHRTFYIHLSQAAKTEIYLAQAPLREDPAFFGLPFTGRTEPRGAGNPPQPQANPWPVSDVTIYDANGVVGSGTDLPTKMWQYLEGENANKDVRIYLTAELQRLIQDGSVCVMERDPRPGIDYDIKMYPPDHPDFQQYDAKCTEALPNSKRCYGWS